MGKDDDCKLLKLQTHILRVNIHCDGCKDKVKKLLNRTEGVFSVKIDVEQQKVTVSGNVDSETLVKRLNKAGKRTEIWSQKPKDQTNKNNQHKPHKQPMPILKDTNNNKTNKEQGKHGLNKVSFIASDDDDSFDEDEEDDDDDIFADLPFLDDKFKHLNFAKLASNGKKNGNAAMNSKSDKKGGNNNAKLQSQIKAPNGHHIHHNKLANNAHFPNANKPNLGEGKKMSDINGMMSNLGNGHANGFNANMLGNLQGAYHHPSSMMMNNMRGHNNNNGNNMMVHENRFMQQPQMMYHRSPQMASPYTGYYKCYPSTNYYVNNQGGNNGDYVTHLFSDENATGCAIM